MFHLFFMLKSYIKGPKTTRLISTYYFIMKIPDKLEFQLMVSNHLTGIEF